jgi:hypothetical protein
MEVSRRPRSFALLIRTSFTPVTRHGCDSCNMSRKSDMHEVSGCSALSGRSTRGSYKTSSFPILPRGASACTLCCEAASDRPEVVQLACPFFPVDFLPSLDSLAGDTLQPFPSRICAGADLSSHSSTPSVLQSFNHLVKPQSTHGLIARPFFIRSTASGRLNLPRTPQPCHDLVPTSEPLPFRTVCQLRGTRTVGHGCHQH